MNFFLSVLQYLGKMGFFKKSAACGSHEVHSLRLWFKRRHIKCDPSALMLFCAGLDVIKCRPLVHLAVMNVSGIVI